MKHALPKTLVAWVSVLALAAPAAASTLTDLEGVRASAAENTIQSRGYYAHHTSPGGGGRYTYWWNNGTKSCVRTLTSNGVIAATKTVSGTDCGQYGSGASSSGSGGNSAAAAAVAAAAIIGVAALAHKSHHRDDQEYQDPNDYADFERGHRDGLYNHSYSNRSGSQSYARGYQSGVDERSAQSTYRPEYRGNSGSGWASDGASFSDLVGARAPGAQSELGNRGFRQVATVQTGGNSAGTIWWNDSTGQCLQMITANGRADSITDIQTHPRCR